MVKTYQEAIHHLYTQLPVYHHIGPKAYKKDLTNTIALCERIGNPQHKFKSIHVAGTNGKGSSSHMLAAILQSAGYKTGLYTSPHLKDFTERIKVNGKDIDKSFVVNFVNRMKEAMAAIQPSFFELTVAMAFEYFAQEKIDIAVIEVGLGGRLDSTNIITPEISLITNIGYDHMDILGDTLPKIAFEKAGIIKKNTPIIISERQPEVADVFIQKAKQEDSDISFASDLIKPEWNQEVLEIKSDYFNAILNPQLRGQYQSKNVAGVIATILKMKQLGWNISDDAITAGINNAVTLTGLKGRWQTLQQNPLVICDTGHNAEGIAELVAQLQRTPHKTLRWIFGIVKDKDASRVLSILPKNAQYYFCQAKIERAMQAKDLCELARSNGLMGKIIVDVNDAIAVAKRESDSNDLIMIGGSTFVVAEVENL